MSKLWRRLLAALVIIALLILIFCVLFRVFVTNRIMDGGNMENPDYILHQHDGENAD